MILVVIIRTGIWKRYDNNKNRLKIYQNVSQKFLKYFLNLIIVLIGQKLSI